MASLNIALVRCKGSLCCRLLILDCYLGEQKTLAPVGLRFVRLRQPKLGRRPPHQIRYCPGAGHGLPGATPRARKPRANSCGAIIQTNRTGRSGALAKPWRTP